SAGRAVASATRSERTCSGLRSLPQQPHISLAISGSTSMTKSPAIPPPTALSAALPINFSKFLAVCMGSPCGCVIREYGRRARLPKYSGRERVCQADCERWPCRDHHSHPVNKTSRQTNYFRELSLSGLPEGTFSRYLVIKLRFIT